MEGAEAAAPAAEKSTRGPMSGDARIVGAKRKMLELPEATRKVAIAAIGADGGNADLQGTAALHADVARVLAFVAPLAPDDRRTLLALVK